ncbi:MAG TPA: hypothetical protein VI636_22255 [Candidatus Angelobacter sp.]
MESIKDQSVQSTRPAPENDFLNAARQRWQQLAEELQADVAEFNTRRSSADFSQLSASQFRVINLTTGLQLVITADFDARTIRYDYQQVNDKSAGTPEGGMLSMRQSSGGAVEFYSADEQLTSEETREILLEVLFPPEAAA